jgi:hypothetical protein
MAKPSKACQAPCYAVNDLVPGFFEAKMLLTYRIIPSQILGTLRTV